MVKLLLIQPPVEDFYDTDIRLQPIGLCSLKAAIRAHLPEVSVRILDFHSGRGRRTIALPKELSYLKPFYAVPDHSPFSSFHHFYHFGADYEDIAAEVAAERPDIIGLSALFSPYYREVLRTAAAIRRKCSATIIVGGSHVSCAPETMLSDNNIDFLILGEGENPLIEFLRVWQSRTGSYSTVPNLAYHSPTGVTINQMAENYPISQLPPPDFDDFALTDYLYEKKPVCMVVTSRGCPHRCAFCSVHRTFGSHYRYRRPLEVVAEMETRYDQGYRVFDFEDDNLSFDRRRFQELCRLLIEHFDGREIELLAMNGISHKSLDRETMQLMRLAGFTHLNLALVSADETVLRSVNRPHNVEQFAQVASEARAMGFAVLAHQILGLPGEDTRSMAQTMAFLARLPVLIGVSVFYLTPGSPISKRFAAMTAADIFRSRSTAMAIESPICSREQLHTLFITARILNFLKGLHVMESITDYRTLAAAGGRSKRETTGYAILETLLTEGRLLAATPRGFALRPCFDASLFSTVWNSIENLVTQEGKIITLPVLG